MKPWTYRPGPGVEVDGTFPRQCVKQARKHYEEKYGVSFQLPCEAVLDLTTFGAAVAVVDAGGGQADVMIGTMRIVLTNAQLQQLQSEAYERLKRQAFDASHPKTIPFGEEDEAA